MSESVERAPRTQLVIPGVGGSSGAALLDPPQIRLVAGDQDAGFYRRATVDSAEQPTEAYSWAGLTSGDWTRALWLLLLPFMLANVGYWMAPAREMGRPGRQLTAEALQRLLALTLTATVVTGAVSVAMDLVGWQCVVDGRACTSTLSFLAWPWVTAPVRRALTAAAPVALVLLLWWLGNRTWQQMESVAVPPAAPVDVRTPLEDRRMWNGRRSVRALRAVHVTAAFAIIAVFLVAGSLAHPGRGLAAVVDPDEWRRPWGRPVVGVLTASLVLLASLIVTALLPVTGRRDRPVATLDARPVEEPLFRWLPWVGAGLVLLAAAATFGPASPADRPVSHPWISGAITTLFAGQVVATAVLVLCCWQPSSSSPDDADLPLWHGLAAVVTAALAWLLQDGLAAGVTLLAADRLGTPGPPAGASGHHRDAFVVAPPVLWAATTAVGVAGVVLIAVAAMLVARRSPAPAAVAEVAAAYRYENFDTDAARQRARAIARDWTAGTMVETLARRGGWLAIAVAAVVTAGVVADLATPADFFQHPSFFGYSFRWPVTVGGWLLGGLVLVLWYVGRHAYSSLAWRRTVGVLWDVGTFWPRAAHPLAPPCYAERAVPDLITRITYLTGTSEQAPATDGRALILAHSQGSVIAAATVLQLCAETSDRVALLVYGSPLRPLYARFFPAYFGPYTLRRVGGLLGGDADVAAARWRNLYRPSDPIGGYVFTQAWPREYASEAERRRAIEDQLEGGVDCVLLDPIFDRRPGDTRYPPTYAHLDYAQDPAFAQAVAYLWGPGQARPVPSEDAAGPTGLRW